MLHTKASCLLPQKINKTHVQLADMEWDTLHHAPDIELSSNCLTSTKTSSSTPSTLRGTMLYSGEAAFVLYAS